MCSVQADLRFIGGPSRQSQTFPAGVLFPGRFSSECPGPDKDVCVMTDIAATSLSKPNNESVMKSRWAGEARRQSFR